MPTGDAYSSGHLVPSLWDLHMFYFYRPILYELVVIIPDYALRISLGTFSILLCFISLRYYIGHHTIQSKGWRQRQFMRSFGKFCSLMNEICKWLNLKLYCRYLYTRPCMINHIWSLKQLWLQVNGHAWFHLQRLRWPIRNGEGAKNSKWKYMSPAGFEPTPCQSTTGKLQRLRPLGHEGLMVISG